VSWAGGMICGLVGQSESNLEWRLGYVCSGRASKYFNEIWGQGLYQNVSELLFICPASVDVERLKEPKAQNNEDTGVMAIKWIG